MKRDDKLIELRREYIAKRIAHSKQPLREKHRLSQELFISIKTVNRDLKLKDTTG